MADTATTRPGGRTARVRDAVLRAAGDALAEHGFESLNLADVAGRAGVGRTTVYRRWGTVPRLIGDLLLAMAEESLSRTDHGSLEQDLRANARLVQKTLADERQGRLFRALVVAGACDDDAGAALHTFYRTRVEEWAPCVTDAIDRGEIPADTDPHAVIRAVSAPLYYALLASGEPLTRALADRSAAAAVAAAKAGVFVSPSASRRGKQGNR